MSRRHGLVAGLRQVAALALAAVLGGAVVWVCLWITKPHPAPVPKRPDPLLSEFDAYRWTTQPEAEFPLPPYAKFLEGVKIVLDPGHGGRGDRKGWKCGPTGLREAEVNLRVAHFLRDFLSQAGAVAVMTREDDVYLDPNEKADLAARIAIANELRADLFLSIHHNGNNNPEANYTSLFYHSTPDHDPASLDAGRYLLAGLYDALRLERHLNCGLISDYAIFPGKGFAVLRGAEVPAILSESSFHSNPEQEKLLRDPVYNRREAYGLFLGLAHWAQAGLPRIRLVEPRDYHARPGQPIVIKLDDGLSGRGGFGLDLVQMQGGSLYVESNGTQVGYAADLSKNEIRIMPTREMLQQGAHLRVMFANTFGQHVLHPWLLLDPAY